MDLLEGFVFESVVFVDELLIGSWIILIIFRHDKKWYVGLFDEFGFWEFVIEF